MNETLTVHPANTATLQTATEIINAATAHDGLPPVSDQALLQVSQGKRELLLICEGKNQAVGIIGEGEIDLVVHPNSRGFGLGTAALNTLLAPHTTQLRAWSHGHNPAADTLLTRAGFHPVRTLLHMRLKPQLLPSNSVDPLTLPTPEGYSLRTFNQHHPDDYAAWVRVNAAAFAHHPEQGNITLTDLTLITKEPWFNAHDLILLESPKPGILAGSTWIKTQTSHSTNGGTECELYAIGVDPDHAGRGLGRLLLDATLARMAQHTPHTVSLYVDGNNTAVAMYEHSGFTVDSSSRQWLRAQRTPTRRSEVPE